MVRDEKGRYMMRAGSKVVVSQLAREILEQPEAVEALAEQARQGVGNLPEQLPPATHKTLMAYAYGEPIRRSDTEDEELKAFRALREEVKRMLKHEPEKAKVIDVSVHRAVSNLRPLPPPGEGDVA